MSKHLPLWAFFLMLLFMPKTTLVAAGGPRVEQSNEAQESLSSPAIFRSERAVSLGAVVLFSAFFFYLIRRSQKGDQHRIRSIAGMEALQDAVGRAAEMGRPALYIPGLLDASDPATAASLSILTDVAYRSARLRVPIKVPNYSPLTWPVAQSVVRDAFVRAGRVEEYHSDDVPYLTSRNMTYSMAVVGMMVRERIATSFLIGHFFSESLILAETGAAIGALQIGGCDSVTQLPFFITTCDYTLIGEELFAAGALIDDDPMSRSAIKTHDWFKFIAILLIIFGLVLGLLDVAGVSGARELAMKIAALLKEAS